MEILIWIYYTLNCYCFHFHIVAAVILMPITLTIVVMIIIYAAIKRHAATKLSCYKHISPITIDNPMSPLPRSTTTHWSYTITDTWILVAFYVCIFLRGNCSLYIYTQISWLIIFIVFGEFFFKGRDGLFCFSRAPIRCGFLFYVLKCSKINFEFES